MKSTRQLIAYDILGAVLSVLALGVGLWTGLVRYPQSERLLHGARNRLEQTRSKARLMDVAIRAKQTAIEDLERKLADEGALPTRTPSDATLRKLTEIAEKKGVKVTNVRPRDLHTHGSLSEHRFSINATCAFDRLVGFLRAFENTEVWADVTEIGIAKDGRDNGTTDAKPSVSLVVSLFSMSHDAESETK